MSLLAVTSSTWMVTGLGFVLVLVLLFVFVYIMKGLGLVMQPRGKAEKNVPAQPSATTAKKAEQSMDATQAAIAMALHLYYNGVHDEEPTQITIKHDDRRYSPWNAKIFGMNNLHRN